MGSEHDQRKPIDEVVRTEFANANHVLRRHPGAYLRMEYVEDGFLTAWLSNLSLADFVSRLDETADLSVSRVTPDAPRLTAARLQTGLPLSPAELASVYLVRADLPDAAIVWERAGDDWADVAVLADTWEAALAYLTTFVPVDELSSVLSEVTAYAS